MSKKFNRERYWNEFPKIESKFIFSKKYTKSFMLDQNIFESLKTICLKALNNSISGDSRFSWNEMLEMLNHTRRFSVKKNTSIFHEIEKLLLDYLLDVNLLSGIRGLEFPVNLRVVHGQAPDDYLARPYPTDYYHTDIWAGEPKDIVLGFIYIAGDIQQTSLEIFEPLGTDISEFQRNIPSYKDIKFSNLLMDKIEYQPETGQLILFDGIIPHRTLRNSGKVRISLDFRLRRIDPYIDIEKEWSRTLAPLSRYWSLNLKRNSSFKEKCIYELDYLKNYHSSSVYKLRKDWCEVTGALDSTK